MSNTLFLAMYFDAPMQAYGVESRYDRRTTLPFPTRSAITGILCAAMGIERDDRLFLAHMADLTIETFVLTRVLSDHTNAGRNTKDRKSGEIHPSRLIDYHTVGAGYDKTSQKCHIPRKADNTTGGTVQSYREYLVDARFGIVVSGDDELLLRCHKALLNPKWGLWFGRKCCIPASPIDQGIHDSSEAAITCLCRLAGCNKPSYAVRDVVSYAEGEETRMDIPVTFAKSERGTGKEFLPRRIVIENE